MMERTDKKSVMEKFEGKILVIAGKYDNAVKTDVMLKNLPEKTNIKSYLLDCGHNGHWENLRFVQKSSTRNCCIICRKNWYFRKPTGFAKL
jgi:hypothetical protein